MVAKSQFLVYVFVFLMIFVLVNFIIVAVRKFQERLLPEQGPKGRCPAKVLYNHSLNPHTSAIYSKTYEKFIGRVFLFQGYTLSVRFVVIRY